MRDEQSLHGHVFIMISVFRRKIICVKCLNCSYKNIARSISFLDKIVIFVRAGKYSYTLELLQLVNP